MPNNSYGFLLINSHDLSQSTDVRLSLSVSKVFDLSCPSDMSDCRWL